MNLAVLENPAGEIAQGLTGRDYLSYSQVSTYQSCPLRWYFQYVAQRPHERVGSSLVFGSAIHAAIEHCYRAVLEDAPVPGLDALLETFDEAWHSSARAPIQFGKSETAESLRRLAGRMLKAFLDSNLISQGCTILAIEEEVRASYIPNVPDLLARVDLIFLTEEALVIRDFKTSRSSWTEAKVAEAAPQLVLYGDLAVPLAQAYGDRPVRLEFCVLTKTQRPQVEVFSVESNADPLRRTRRIIERVWSAMQGGHLYPNPTPQNCSSCPFQRACRDWCD